MPGPISLKLAGQRKGMSISQANGGTRSGLLWEVERILDELSNRERERERSTRSCQLPKILLMENVPQVLSAIDDFNKWIAKLETLGYTNYWQVLNSKDYGIPQNRKRCFMLSILGDYSYEFPLKVDLRYKLKDFLETKVDEKYYLSSEDVERIQGWNSQEKPLETMLDIDDSEFVGTLTTHCGKDGGG